MSSRDSSTKARRPAVAQPDLTGRRILVIEDSPVLAPFTADILGELGCDVIGPAPNMAVARQLIEEKAIDAALMDVHIRGERVFPLCDLLESRGVPYILTSGYADWQMPDKLQKRPRLQKPYTIAQVQKALVKLLR
jgi:CheY-like chemotaxis protein